MGNQYKTSLDQIVSELSGVSRKLTSKVTTALYETLLEQLVAAGEVTIPGLGTLRVFTSNTNREVTLCNSDFKGGRKKTRLRVFTQVRIYFSKAQRLRRALKERDHGKVRSKRVD
jgi:hypothetical protein